MWVNPKLNKCVGAEKGRHPLLLKARKRDDAEMFLDADGLKWRRRWTCPFLGAAHANKVTKREKIIIQEPLLIVTHLYHFNTHGTNQPTNDAAFSRIPSKTASVKAVEIILCVCLFACLHSTFVFSRVCVRTDRNCKSSCAYALCFCCCRCGENALLHNGESRRSVTEDDALLIAY